ncbi:MAG: hypothetical protein MK365_17470, partial [Vicinamibacterales bacterium]|nr:hypothetical protein [Vicinamibacterales bacterium]
MRAQGERWSSRMPDLRLVLSRALILPVAITAVTLVPTQVMGQAQSSAEFVPVTDAMLQAPAPEDWLMWRRTLDSWGYSPLDQVTRENVADLRMVWTRALARGRQEGTPLVYD